MKSNKYVQLNKYFAFVFMVFAVMSGVSDEFSDANVLSAKGSESSYFLSINHLFTKDISRIKIKVSENKQNAFNAFIQDIADIKGASSYAILYLVIGVLSFALFTFNNHIIKNNLWRASVF